MNVLLVNPWFTSRTESVRSFPSEPLGLMCLATYAKKLANISIMDAWMDGASESYRTEDGYRSGLTDSEFLNALDGYRPDLVGIHCNYTFGAVNAFAAARLVKRWNLGVKVILGGAHATLDAKRIVQRPEIDMVCVGEGEKTFAELLSVGIDSEQQVDGLQRKDGIFKPRAQMAAEEIPTPDRGTVFRYCDYLRPTYFHTMQAPVATVSTSRGCPFRCMFCSTHVAWGNKFRFHRLNTP